MNERATTERRRHLFARRCVACGYDGSMLRGGAAERCARCGCDLLERPARSYAEMEGLVGGVQPATPAAPAVHSTRGRGGSHLVERWLWFAFLSMLLLFAIAALAANAVGSAS